MKRLVRRAAWTLLVLALPAGALLWFGSRPWFVQEQILPRVSKAMGLPVTAERVRFAPLWRLDLGRVRAGLPGQPLAFTCDDLQVRYRFRSLLRGVFEVVELRVDGAAVHLVRQADGRWTVPGAPPPASADVSGQAKPPRPPLLELQVASVKAHGVSIILEQPPTTASVPGFRFEIYQANLQGSGWRPGGSLVITWQGRLRGEQGPGSRLEHAFCRGAVSADLDASWRPQNLKIEGGITGMAGQICGVPLESGEAVLSAALGRWGLTTAEVNAFKVTLAQNRRDTLRINLTAPVVLGRRATGRFVMGGGSSRLLVHVQDLALPQLNPLFQPLFGVAFDAGTVGGDLTAEVTGQGRNVTLKGTLGGEQLAFHLGTRTWRAVAVNGLIEANIAELNRVSIYRAETEIAVAGVPCLRWQCTGSLDLGKSAGDLAVAITLCNEKALLLVPEWRARPPLTTLDATANLNLILTATRQKTAGLTGTINVVRLKSAAMAPGASPVAATLVVDGLATPAGAATARKEWRGPVEVRLNSLKGRFQRDDHDLADLEVGGRLFWPLSAGENTITTQSEFIDGRAVWAVLGEVVPALRNLAAPASAKPAAADAGFFPATEPAPGAEFDGLNVRWRCDCRRFLWTPLDLTSLSLEVKLKENRLFISPLDCSLNGAPVELNASCDYGVGDGYPFTVNLDVAGLDVAPLLAAFQPAFVDRVQGRIVQLTVNASGKGMTRANLTRSLRGNAVLHAADVTLANLPVLDQAAAKTGIDELRQLRLDAVSWRFDTLPDGQIKISEGLAKGPDVSLGVSGVTGWDEILDLKVALGVGGTVEQRLKRDGLTPLLGRRAGDYLMLPAAIPVAGTWAKPEIKISRREVTAAAAQAAQNVLGVIQEVKTREGHANFKSVIKALLTGTATTEAAPAGATTPTSAAVPAK